ncbi:MAG: DUF1385 domain-containing protein [Armatimonadetes bacterium]|nr:DUF1385 domain-containing protein [Armatimonadota bacterium]MBX3109521.1 DUF1385 domain-containing protein [Fimbriimonadaceae bacterium]
MSKEPQAEYLQFGGMAVPEGVMMRSPKFYAVACRAPNGEIIVKTEPLEKTWIGKLEFLKKPFLRGTLALLDTMALGMRAMNFASQVQLDERYLHEDDRAKAREESEAMLKPTAKEYRNLVVATLVLAILSFVFYPFWAGLTRGEAFDANKMLAPIMVPIAAGICLVFTLFWAPIKRALSTNEKLAIGVAVVFSLGFGFVLFKAVPEGSAEFVTGYRPSSLGHATYLQGVWTNFVAESLKVVMFVGYLLLIRRIPAILDTFKYHGAEHKAINAIEANVELNEANCLAQTRLHPRCGTNFAIIVVILGFLMSVWIPRYPTLFGYQVTGGAAVVTRLTLELFVLMPVIAGISYEVIRAAGKMKDQKWVGILLKPGLATQLITTEEPEAKHVEVAIRSLKAVLAAEESGVCENTEVPAVSPSPQAG